MHTMQYSHYARRYCAIIVRDKRLPARIVNGFNNWTRLPERCLFRQWSHTNWWSLIQKKRGDAIACSLDGQWVINEYFCSNDHLQNWQTQCINGIAYNSPCSKYGSKSYCCCCRDRICNMWTLRVLYCTGHITTKNQYLMTKLCGISLENLHVFCWI